MYKISSKELDKMIEIWESFFQLPKETEDVEIDVAVSAIDYINNVVENFNPTSDETQPSKYSIPVYTLNEGLRKTRTMHEITFVKSDFEGELNASDGVISEDILAMLLVRLYRLNEGLPNEETRKAMVHINRAIKCLTDRKNDRAKRGVTGTREL